MGTCLRQKLTSGALLGLPNSFDRIPTGGSAWTSRSPRRVARRTTWGGACPAHWLLGDVGRYLAGDEASPAEVGAAGRTAVTQASLEIDELIASALPLMRSSRPSCASRDPGWATAAPSSPCRRHRWRCCCCASGAATSATTSACCSTPQARARSRGQHAGRSGWKPPNSSPVPRRGRRSPSPTDSRTWRADRAGREGAAALSAGRHAVSSCATPARTAAARHRGR
jgi:hypothetical protein